MELSEIIPHIEALIFASERPLTSLEIVDLINNAFGFMEQQINLDQVETALDGIREKYNSDFYPFEVLQSGGGWQFLSKPSFHTTIAQLNGGKFLKKLSNSALETLSIIAYKQPITKGEIESIRGVNSDYSVQKLLEKELIIISGRSETLPGKPLIYETSKSFMDYFGLNSSDDLPKIREVLAEQMVEPTAQQRNVEEDADFGIFKKDQSLTTEQPTTESIEEFSDLPIEQANNQETDTNNDDNQPREEILDADEVGEEEMADQELRAEIAQGNEDLHEALQADLTDIHPATPHTEDEFMENSEADEEEIDEDMDEENDHIEDDAIDIDSASATETDLEDEELADELSHDSQIEDDQDIAIETNNDFTEDPIRDEDDHLDEDVQNEDLENQEDQENEDVSEQADEALEEDDQEFEDEDEVSEDEDQDDDYDEVDEEDEDEENMKNK